MDRILYKTKNQLGSRVAVVRSHRSYYRLVTQQITQVGVIHHGKPQRFDDLHQAAEAAREWCQPNCL